MSLLRSPKRSSACPCKSGSTFGACCEPFLRGAEAPTAEKLMRSRFTAYAVGAASYILDTLHPDHADRSLSTEVFLAALKRETSAVRFLDLTVEATTEDGHRATVTFTAKIMKQAVDRSFRECSEFARTDRGWRYLRGETLPYAKETLS